MSEPKQPYEPAQPNQLEQPYQQSYPGQTGPPQGMETVIVTAVVTAAVVPFVQTLVQKAAEDTYDAVRDFLRRRFREARATDEQPAGWTQTLLVVRDDSPGLELDLYAEPDMDDEAIRTLLELDMTEATKGRDKKVRIYWDALARRWWIEDD